MAAWIISPIRHSHRPHLIRIHHQQMPRLGSEHQNSWRDFLSPVLLVHKPRYRLGNSACHTPKCSTDFAEHCTALFFIAHFWLTPGRGRNNWYFLQYCQLKLSWDKALPTLTLFFLSTSLQSCPLPTCWRVPTTPRPLSHLSQWSLAACCYQMLFDNHIPTAS